MNWIILIIILIIIGITMTLNYIGKNITPIIIDFASLKAKKIATLVINQAVDEKLVESFNSEELFITDGKTTNYNTASISKLLKDISINVRDYLKKLETGKITNLGLVDDYTNVNEKKLKNGIIYEVPTGVIFNNGLLANIGPKIPIKLSLIGDITTDIIVDVKEYGINNAIVQLSVNIKVTEQLILPFSYEQISVETNIPLAIKIINGEVPGYYIGNPYKLSSE